MKASWSKRRLGDVCRVIPGYAFKSSDWREDGIPVVKIKNIKEDNTVDLSETDCVPQSLLTDKLHKFVLKDEDIVVAMTGATAGKVGRVRTNSLVFLNQRVAKISPTEADAGFIWAVVSSDEYQKAFFYLADGAAQPNMSASQIAGVEIPFPPLPMQRRVSEIVSAYDELVDNNKRRILLLEQTIRTIYREWFIHFRFPGHHKCPLVASHIGKIPKGWEIRRLEQLADIKGGKQLAKEDIHEVGVFPVFGGNGIQGYSHNATHQGFVIAFGRVGANCGSIHWSYEGAWLNNNSSSIVPLKHDELILHHLLTFHFSSLRSGAAQPFISNSALAGIGLVVPNDGIAEQFCSLVKPMRMQQVVLEHQLKNLRQTRDLLLPRLISGELKLRAA